MELPELMVKVGRAMGGRFSLNGRPMTLDEVFSPMGLLPGMCRRADQLASLCLGYGLGFSFEEAEGSILGVKVVFDDLTPNSLRVLCLTDVVNELMMASSGGDMAPLDQLMYD